MRKISFLFVIVAFSAISVFAQNAKITEGSLFAVNRKGDELGACPLKHTSVRTDISGFLARVTVTQEFENNFNEPIEAVYTFPLSQNSAVDDMTMKIGERTIRGRIMKREEARKVYEQAKTEGKTASLLDQERPNIFTQSVANILPNEKIIIEISYVETLKYEDGSYEFVFPMVVGPRYIPSSVKKEEAQKISPPVAAIRAGRDVSIEVNLNAGVPVEGILSSSHQITMTNLSPNSAKISLREEKTIPNKDFILRYDVTGKRIEDAILTHRDIRGGFFTLILQPPDKFAFDDVTPKEIVFVLDTSGSMSGFPIEKAKEAMRLALDGLNPQDTFNLITFAGDTSILFDAPVPATPANLSKAQDFLASRQGYGGTEMMKAIRAALEPTASQKHLRVVCFMTDGYVGNEGEIIAEIQKHPNARVFSFGIGSSVNRFLLDKMAEEGRGEVEYVSLKDDGSAAAKRFHERIRNPLLTDISIDWNSLPIEDVYPKRIGDLFSAKPVVLNGRYRKGANGAIRLKGKVSGQTFVREIPVIFPETEYQNDVLATLWARRKIDDLMSGYYKEARNEPARKEIQDQITLLGIDYHLLTQFTSFVAVEERIVNQNGQPTRVEVPVEMPEGVKRETTLGDKDTPFRRLENIASLQRPPTVTYSGSGSGQGSGGGIGSGRGTVQEKNQPTDSEKKAFAAIRVDGSSSTENVVVIEGQANSNNELPQTNSGGSVTSEILNRIEAHQKALKSLRANITTTKYNAGLGENEVNEGVITYLPQGNDISMRIDWTKPRQEIITVVKENYLIYRPSLKIALTGKVDGTKKNALTLIFMNLSKEKLKENYTVRYLGEEMVNGSIQTWHLELTPKTPIDYKSVELWIDASGMPIQAKVIEDSGDWTNVLLTLPQKNVGIKLTDFKIDLPKETKIINN